MEITVGIDIVDIDRFEITLKRYGNRFVKRIYTEKEIETITKQEDRISYIAASFSLKEAIWKALPDEKQKEFYFKDIEIMWNKGRPEPVLKGEKETHCLTLKYFRKGNNIITTAIFFS